MSERLNKDENEQLDALYQRRKRRYQSPSSVKTEMLGALANKSQEKTPWWKIDFTQYFKISAFVATAALAFIVISTHLITQQTNNAPLNAPNLIANAGEYLSVEFHVIESDELISGEQNTVQKNTQGVLANSSPLSSSFNNADIIANNATQRKINYKQALDNYQNKQSELISHHQTYARIVNTEQGLSLVTCEQELLQISQEVIDLLFPDKRQQTIDFTDGKLLALSFDDKGHIIEMRQQTLKNQC